MIDSTVESLVAIFVFTVTGRTERDLQAKIIIWKCSQMCDIIYLNLHVLAKLHQVEHSAKQKHKSHHLFTEHQAILPLLHSERK